MKGDRGHLLISCKKFNQLLPVFQQRIVWMVRSRARLCRGIVIGNCGRVIAAPRRRTLSSTASARRAGQAALFLNSLRLCLREAEDGVSPFVARRAKPCRQPDSSHARRRRDERGCHRLQHSGFGLEHSESLPAIPGESSCCRAWYQWQASTPS